VSQPGLGSEPIGVFDHPPPAGSNISSIQLRDPPGTSGYLAAKGLFYLTNVERYVRHLLP
jgi:hypothetical protein